MLRCKHARSLETCSDVISLFKTQLLWSTQSPAPRKSAARDWAISTRRKWSPIGSDDAQIIMPAEIRGQCALDWGEEDLSSFRGIGRCIFSFDLSLWSRLLRWNQLFLYLVWYSFCKVIVVWTSIHRIPFFLMVGEYIGLSTCSCTSGASWCCHNSTNKSELQFQVFIPAGGGDRIRFGFFFW